MYLDYDPDLDLYYVCWRSLLKCVVEPAYMAEGPLMTTAAAA